MKKEIAKEMLLHLRNGRPDNLMLICEMTVVCRDHVIRNRENNNRGSSMYTPEEGEIAVIGGELVDEVLPLLKKEDLNGVEAVLRVYAS